MQNIIYSDVTLVRGISPSHVTGDATGRADMCVRVGGEEERQFDFDSFCSFYSTDCVAFTVDTVDRILLRQSLKLHKPSYYTFLPSIRFLA